MRTLKATEIIKNIAKEEGLSVTEVREILTSHFEFVRHVQSNLVDRDAGYFPSVRLLNFGIFYIPEKIQDRLKIYNKKVKDESSGV